MLVVFYDPSKHPDGRGWEARIRGESLVSERIYVWSALLHAELSQSITGENDA